MSDGIMRKKNRMWLIVCGAGLILILSLLLGLLITSKLVDHVISKSRRGPWHEWTLSQEPDELTEELALEYVAKVMEKDGFDMKEWKPVDANPSFTCPGEKFVARGWPDNGPLLKEGSIRYINRPEPIRDVELELKDGKIRGRVWREK